jgi:hypothetical protein
LRWSFSKKNNFFKTTMGLQQTKISFNGAIVNKSQMIKLQALKHEGPSDN